MIRQFFNQEVETVNVTYHKIYILNTYLNSLNSGTRILCTQQKQKPPKQYTKYIHDRSLLTKSSEVPNLSSSKDWMREIWTPISLWMPEHSMQVKIPKLVESQVGSVERILKTRYLIFSVPTTEEAKTVVKFVKNYKGKI